MPARVIDHGRHTVLYVRDRSTLTTAFFRVSDRNHSAPIFPGDEKVVMSVQYFVDHEVFWSRGNLFEQPVRATLFRPGYRPLAVEKPFGNLQIF